jgi:hypothetical protein
MSTEAAESKDVDMADVATTETTEEVSKQAHQISSLLLLLSVERTLLLYSGYDLCNAIA